jgi:uncharacterized phage protein (TIGR01671 family)
MREIKFRAWHTALNEWLTDELMRQYITWMKGELYVPANIRLMQFTGLKDKNGAEIYEGDIIFGGVTYGTGSAIPPPHEVKWEIVTIVKPYCDGQVTRVGFFFDEYDYTLRGCEVLGNIYENPELLEGPE